MSDFPRGPVAVSLERAVAQADLLRFSTAGSVDDGKSTLIGRLLYESKQIFDDIRSDFEAFASGLDVEITYIPVSALHGDNVVERSERMPWYAGPSLLEFLEEVPAVPRHSLPGRGNCGLSLRSFRIRRCTGSMNQRRKLLCMSTAIPRLWGGGNRGPSLAH